MSSFRTAHAGPPVEVAGVSMPNDYGDAEAEYRALKEAAGLLPCPHRGLLWVYGEECAELVHSLTTNQVEELAVGQGCYNTFSSKVGKMLAEGWCMVREDGIAISTARDRVEWLVDYVEGRIISERADIGEVVGYEMLHLAGPRAADVLEQALGRAPDLAPGHLADTPLGGVDDAFLYRNDYLGIDGYDWIGEEEGTEAAVRTLLDAGATLVGFQAAEWMRIERGVPRYGLDLDEHNLAVEGGLEERAISYTKGCYLGQEIVARLKTYGTPARMLRGVRFEGEDPPPPTGTPIYADNREIGTISSRTVHPELGPIALALLKRGFYEAPWELAVGEERRPATSCDLPFQK